MTDTTTQNNAAAIDETDPGVAPEAIDDAELRTVAKSYEKDEREALKELDPDGIVPQVVKEDARGKIAADFQARRKAERVRDADAPDDDASLREQLKLTNVVTGGQIRNEEDEPIAPAAAAPAEAKLRVKVYGKEYDVPLHDDRWFNQGATEEQIRRNAQITLGAEAKLAAANARTSEPNQIQDGVAQPPTPAYQPAAVAGEQPTGRPAPRPMVPREKITDIVDRIQNGTQEDGEQAVQDMIEAAAAAVATSAQDVQGQVNAALSLREQSREIEDASKAFAADNADLLGKPLLGDFVLKTVHEKMLDGMRHMGIKKELLDPIRGQGNVIATVYNDFRTKGYDLKTHRELLDEAEGVLRSTFNIPKPHRTPPSAAEAGRVLSQRAQEKRQMQTQPRSAGARSAVTAQGPKPLTRQEYIQAEKQRRMGGRTAT